MDRLSFGRCFSVIETNKQFAERVCKNAEKEILFGHLKNSLPKKDKYMIEDKLRTMPIKELRAFVDSHFHNIPHTLSFAILIDRLEQTEEKLCVSSKIFDKIYQTLKERNNENLD